MKLSLEWFCIVIFSIALKKSSAEIPGCDFQDTVDISNAAIQNDTYIYDGLKIPADLVGEYRTRQLIDGSTVPVQSHLRACICQLPRPCVRFCCFQDNLLDQDECSDGLREVIARKKPYLDLYYMNLDNMTVTSRKHYLHSEITVLRTQSLGCKEITLKQKDFLLFEDGELLIGSLNRRLTKSDYCLTPEQSYSTFPMSLKIVINECEMDDRTTTIVEDNLAITNNAAVEEIPKILLANIRMISMVFLILTLTVYVTVKKLRNLIGKCLICSLFCLSIVILIRILEDYKLLGSVSSPAAYTLFFFTMTYSLWDSVISFCLWKDFRSPISEESRYGFKFYNAFVWSTVAILTGAIFLIDEVSAWNWLPLTGFLECSVTISKSCLYYQVPILILSTFNVIMFILTAIFIWKVRSQEKEVVEEEGRLTHPIFDSQNYVDFFRLFLMMCISWILKLFLVWRQISELVQHVYFVIDYFESILGLIIFVLLILRRKTLSHLIIRIRTPRDNQPSDL
ncbi:probable G-protein coupled receptor Mth-like 7 [Drosophila suzukii]|uniref:Probable G-protein coupled receptor Mth-like 7 n=1 Tax=Drosophila suzukii TaxID=28584 RepID=A0ABM4TSH4_DROSZ